MAHEQRAQDHDAAFVVQLFRRRDVQFFKDKLREALEGENLQARVAVKRIIGEQLALELEGGLFGREKNERRACGIFLERGTDFGEAAEGFTAAGGAEEKARLHDLFSRKRANAQMKNCRHESHADFFRDAMQSERRAIRAFRLPDAETRSGAGNFFYELVLLKK